MWTCTKCKRVFKKEKQPHSCETLPLSKHFQKKEIAKDLFEILVDTINREVGLCKIISLPCCIHLYGIYDFLAALPKKDRLEIRFELNHVLNSPRLKQSIPLSSKNYKNCLDIHSKTDINEKLISWIKEAYYLKK